MAAPAYSAGAVERAAASAGAASPARRAGPGAESKEAPESKEGGGEGALALAPPSFLQRAEATALPDPFGFSRRR
jgi:hypothetical protein